MALLGLSLFQSNATVLLTHQPVSQLVMTLERCHSPEWSMYCSLTTTRPFYRCLVHHGGGKLSSAAHYLFYCSVSSCWTLHSE